MHCSLSARPVAEISLSRKLKLQQLAMVARIIEEGSLLRAANALGMTQPAVTKALHELEAYFEAPLFERTNRGVKPTALGHMVGRRAKAMLSEIRFLTDEVNAYRDGTAGHVVVGTLIAASARLLPAAIVRLHRQSPDIRVTVREVSTPQLFPALMAGDIDLAVGRLPEPDLAVSHPDELRHEVLFHESWCLVAGARHTAGLPAHPRLADLMHLLWILPLPDSPARAVVERMFRDERLPLPEHAVESLSLLTNLGMLLEAPCLGLMPWAAAQQFIQAGLLRRLDLLEQSEFGAVGYTVRADRPLRPASSRFIACLQEVAAEGA